MSHDDRQPPRAGSGAHGNLVLKLCGLAAGMFVFGFLLVPIYDVFCEITGIGGKFDNVPATVETRTPMTDRTVTVEFIASLNEYAPWEFRPDVASMEVRPGEMYDTTFFAHNLTDRTITGQAVPSIAPGLASKYFRKTECFCFTSQDFEPQEARHMPLQFVVDPELPEHIDRLTLSYTFFLRKQVAQAGS